MSPGSCLDNIPQEILEHIAFFTATADFEGPPTAIVSLLLTNRQVYSYLSIPSNPHLYARIFAHKFDIVPAIHRLGPDRASATILSNELQRRCVYLRRVRLRLDTTVPQAPCVDYDEQAVQATLWVCYLMMLENSGKNERQLRNYAQMEEWLREYWFHPQGSSLTTLYIKMDLWPPNDEQNSLAMWLFWFLLKPESYTRDTPAFRNVLNILKLLALGAHQYDLCSPSWVEFLPEAQGPDCKSPLLYLETHSLTPPPLAPPAILSYLALANNHPDFKNAFPSASAFMFSPESHDWDTEWKRCLSLGQTIFQKSLCGAFAPGSIQGVWEGMFTYTEFTAYAALLSGAPPPVLNKSLVAQHRQTWKLREYHFSAPSSVTSSPSLAMDLTTANPLSAGNALNAYFPFETKIFERSDGIEVHDPGRSNPLFYRKATYQEPFDTGEKDDDSMKASVQDVIVLGEGHSAWGQFNLTGRIRPCDGFICMSKDYVGGDRGKWLYRGYLVGNANGNLAGRWRDTLSPANMAGYEGCFAMSRRR